MLSKEGHLTNKKKGYIFLELQRYRLTYYFSESFFLFQKQINKENNCEERKVFSYF